GVELVPHLLLAERRLQGLGQVPARVIEARDLGGRDDPGMAREEVGPDSGRLAFLDEDHGFESLLGPLEPEGVTARGNLLETQVVLVDLDVDPGETDRAVLRDALEIEGARRLLPGSGVTRVEAPGNGLVELDLEALEIAAGDRHLDHMLARGEVAQKAPFFDLPAGPRVGTVQTDVGAVGAKDLEVGGGGGNADESNGNESNAGENERGGQGAGGTNEHAMGLRGG